MHRRGRPLARVCRIGLNLLDLPCVPLAVEAHHDQPLVAVQVPKGRVRGGIIAEIRIRRSGKTHRAFPRFLEFLVLSSQLSIQVLQNESL